MTMRIFAFVLPPLFILSPAHAQTRQDTPVSVVLGDRGGICTVGFPREGRTDSEPPLTLEFSYRVRDGNFGATVKTNSWSFVSGKDTDKTVPLTLVFDTGKSATSRSGGYESGYDESVWGGWGPGAGSDAAFALLKGARAATVKFDGTDLGQWNLKLPGFAATLLTRCADRLRSAAP